MTFIPTLNAGSPQGLTMGYSDAQLSELNLQAVQLNPNSTATFFYGLPVKVIGQNTNGMTIVDAITVNTDPIWGIIMANSYLPVSNLLKGAIVNIMQGGLQATVVMLATGTITAGNAVGWNVSGGGVAANTVVAQRLGIAETNGTNGSFVTIRLTVPNAANPNF